MILRFGTEEQKQRYLPGIIAGETSFCIGMSEPDSGSDLASVRTRATRDGDGWRVTGTKIWTSNAHRADYCILFCRTEDAVREAPRRPEPVHRRPGATEGLTVRPIFNIAGSHDFNEVVFDNAYLPNDCLLGEPGNGWEQVTSELSLERAGPDRFLTNLAVLSDLVGVLGPDSASAESARRDRPPVQPPLGPAQGVDLGRRPARGGRAAERRVGDRQRPRHRLPAGAAGHRPHRRLGRAGR